MKRIAVITGASSGMGRCFAQSVDSWGGVDEVWAIARRQERLQELRSSVPVRPLPMDLTDRSNYAVYAKLLAEDRQKWCYW